MAEKRIFKIIYLNQGEIYEIYARSVDQGHLYGFIEVEELIFGERARVVVDPSEERLKDEFSGVTRTYIPIHAVIRIDEVEKEGIGKILDNNGNKVTPFPVAGYSQSPGNKKD